MKKYKDSLNSMGLIKFINVRNNSVFLGVDNSRIAFTTVNKWLLDNKVDFNAMEIVEPSLEDVFLSLTGSENNREEE
jgi:ABC-2 type transport system ATP-binding protein